MQGDLKPAFAFALQPGETDGVAAIYLPRLAAALGALGYAVTIEPIADDASKRRFLDAAASAVPVIDGALLGVFEPHGEALGDRLVVVLHRAPSSTPLLAAAGALIVSSSRVAASIVDANRRLAARLTVLPPGYDRQARHRDAADGPCRILAVGGLVPRKGHALLIDALTRLFDLDWTLTIAGDGARDPAHVASLRIRVEASELAPRIRLLETLAPDALAHLWSEADVFALASAWEGAFTTLGDALRRGIPAVVTQPSDMAIGGSAVICPPGDAVTLSKALRRVIFDRALRRSMADAAWEAGSALPDWPTQANIFAATARSDVASGNISK